jgi:Putative Flp pilus-assembly TadE/G-like
MLQRALRSLTGGGREDGQALVLFAAGLVAFLGLVGLSVDVGHRLWARTDQQKAADAAAVAGINKFLDTQSIPLAKAAAQEYATLNGYSGAQVVVNSPPTSGPHSSNPKAIEVIVTKPVQKFFIGVVYSGQWKATARAVAKEDVKLEGFGVITLHPTACSSLQMDSNASINVTGGGVFVNSSCAPNAMNMNSNASAIAATVINIVGEHQGLSNATTSPAPTEHSFAVPDPFASVVPPTPNIPAPPLPEHPPILRPNGLPVPAASNGQCNNLMPAVTYSDNGWYRFEPGRYRCQIEFASNASAIFMPGQYYFEKGLTSSSNNFFILGRGIYYFGNGGAPQSGQVYGLYMKSNGGLYDRSTYAGENGALPAYATPAVMGTGALLYNGCPGPCGTSGKIELNSNAVMKLQPYGAPYMNLLIWQDRNSPTELELNSNAHTSPGAVYAANATLTLNSNATSPAQFVVGKLHMDSNAKIHVNITNSTKVEIKTYRFVE